MSWGAALEHLRRDRRLRPVIDRVGPPRLRRRPSYFAALGSAIIYQQLSGKAAATIQRRLVDQFPGRPFPTPEQLLSLDPEAMRAVGLSRQKSSYLRDLAEKYGDGTLTPRRWRRMSDREVIDDLVQVKGIGVWTAQMFLMFTLHRPDVLAVGDLGLQKGFEQLFGLDGPPDAETMERLAERWRPYRTIACWYLWRVADGGGA